MLSLSVASRLVGAELLAPRLAAVALKACTVAAAAPYSTMPSARSLPVLKPAMAAAAAPLFSLLGRGMATRTGASAAKRKPTGKKASGGANKRSTNPAGRGARSGKKKASSAAASKAKARASAARAKKDAARKKQVASKRARTERLKKNAAKKAAAKKEMQARRRAQKEKRERSLRQQRAEMRARTIAKRQARRLREHQHGVARRARQRQQQSRRRLNERLREQAERQVRRQAAFRKKHPTLAKQRRLEAQTGMKPPRRPATAMSAYVKAHFQEVQADMSRALPPGGKPKAPEVLKAVAAQFKALPAEARAKLDAEAKSRRDDYEKQKAKFEAAGPPKKPLTAYINYFLNVNKDVARSLPAGTRITEVSKKIGEQWRALSAEEKARYQTQADRDLAEWKDKLAAWVDAHPGAVLHTPTGVGSTLAKLKAEEAKKHGKTAKPAKKTTGTIRKRAAKQK